MMYLPGEAVRDLFHQCGDITGAESRVAFSYIPTGDDGRPDAGRRTGLMLWLLKAQGEPWLWSIRPEELGGFLSGTGWRDDLDLAETSDRHGVEYFAVAQKLAD
jgi:O-methyltransferase involved in polyketide biosynthesis